MWQGRGHSPETAASKPRDTCAPSISRPAQSTLEGLVTVLAYALQPGRAPDFRLCVRQTQRGQSTERSLHLWCLNPAVAFSQLTGKAR